MTEIQKKLRELSDPAYRDFQAKLIPNIPAEKVIGVRTPALRAYAKELLKSGSYQGFLSELPHEYFDEDQLHAFIISGIKDFDNCASEVERFLPFVDNWATCDQLSPAVVAKKKGGRLVRREELLGLIDGWLSSDKTYTVRFGVKLLMQHFLDAEFEEKFLDRVAEIRSDEYYINMVIAWYFATALAKQYDAALAVLEEKRLERWTHNKTIQKAIESYRITPDQKAYLRTLKIKH